MRPYDCPPLDHLDADSLALLRRYRFDASTFLELAHRLADRGAGGMDNRLLGAVTPPEAGDLATLPNPGSARWERLSKRGMVALGEGALAVVVLNGGMATRFGGVVKGVVEAYDGRSFLQLTAERIGRLAERAGSAIPLLLMNSFATSDASEEHLRRTGYLGLSRDLVRCFDQSVSPRLTDDGALFVDDEGRASLYGPGHGDFPGSIRESGLLPWLSERGVRHVALYNVDNLGACPHPVVLGHHIESGRSMTAELVPKLPGDKGGAPARVGGHLEVVEEFRFPPAFDQDSIPAFNCNTFVFDLDLLSQVFPLDWFTVRKQVDGRAAIQFERLVGQMTAFVDANYLIVPRAGTQSRFLPVKHPDDLDAIRSDLRLIFD